MFILQKRNGLIYRDLNPFQTRVQAELVLSISTTPETIGQYRIFDVEASERENEALLDTIDWSNVSCEDVANAIEKALATLPDLIKDELRTAFVTDQVDL